MTKVSSSSIKTVPATLWLLVDRAPARVLAQVAVAKARVKTVKILILSAMFYFLLFCFVLSLNPQFIVYCLKLESQGETEFVLVISKLNLTSQVETTFLGSFITALLFLSRTHFTEKILIYCETVLDLYGFGYGDKVDQNEVSSTQSAMCVQRKTHPSYIGLGRAR